MNWDDPRDDASLLDRCRRSDAAAWSALIARYQRLVYSIPRRIGLNADDASDVFQATWHALFRSLDRIDSPEALAKWLSVTAARESYRMKRIASKTTNLGDDATQPLEEMLASEEKSADTLAFEAGRADLLMKTRDKLPIRCRSLIEALYDVSEPSYEEISRRVGIPVGAIGPTRARCLEKFRKLLAQNGFFEDSRI